MIHPFLSKNADLGCRHLCMAEPTKHDELAMAEFLSTAKYQGKPVPDSCFPVDHRALLASVR